MSERFSFALASFGVACLFGMTVLLPNIWQQYDAGYPYAGIFMMPSDAEIHYMARVREYYDGNTAVANTFYKEPKDIPYMQPPYPESSIAMTARVFGLDPAWVFIWSKGLFAFVLTLVCIGCTRSLSGKRWESLLAVTALLFAGSMLSAPWDIWSLFTGDRMFEVLRFSRPINPLWTCIWFFGALWLISVWIRKRALWSVSGAALCTVVLLNSYVYAWTFLGVAMAVLFFRYLWLKDWVRVRDLLLFVFIFLLFGSPYFWHLFATMQHPFYETASQRLGMSQLRTPIIGVWAIVFAIITGCASRIWKKQWWLIIGLVVACFVSLNQHVVTGAYLVPHHYHWYFVQPLASITTIIVVLSLLGMLPVRMKIRRWFSVAVMSVSICIGILVQMRAYDALRAEWGNVQVFAPVIEAAHQLPAESAVYANDRVLLDLLPIYTGLNVYASTNANTYLVDPNQVKDAFWFELWIDGLSADAASKEFSTNMRALLSSRIYNIYYREYLGNYDRIPDDVVDLHVQEYQSYLARSLQDKLCRWPLDSIIFTPHDKQTPVWRQLYALTTHTVKGETFEIRNMPLSICAGYTRPTQS